MTVATSLVAMILAADDLDDLNRAVRALDRLDAADQRAIAEVVERWQDRQALANVLMYPKLIPQPLRAHALVRALADASQPYLSLAAAVGFEKLDARSLTADERATALDHLIATVKAAPDLVAVRAAVALGGHVEADDLARVVPLLTHPDDRVVHNTLVALLEVVDVATIAAAIARAPALPAGRVAAVRARLADPPDTPILPYLPSLRACTDPVPAGDT